MNHFMPDINRRAKLMQGSVNYFNRSVNTSAKTPG
jgi:hypothetical protein